MWMWLVENSRHWAKNLTSCSPRVSYSIVSKLHYALNLKWGNARMPCKGSNFCGWARKLRRCARWNIAKRIMGPRVSKRKIKIAQSRADACYAHNGNLIKLDYPGRSSHMTCALDLFVRVHAKFGVTHCPGAVTWESDGWLLFIIYCRRVSLTLGGGGGKETAASGSETPLSLCSWIW